MSRRNARGMQRNVQVALGVVDQDGPEIYVGPCACGREIIIGVDREVPTLLARGLAFGRMVEYCQRCLRPSKIYNGPPMLTRDDLEGPDAVVFFRTAAGKRRSTARA
jgi:hypothetical protein